jgi:hypothetical protein
VRCSNTGADTVLVGLHRVGLVGLRAALEKADRAGLDGRDAIVDRLIELLSTDNYIPDSQLEPFRLALWREHLRHRGKDIRPFYSEIEVTVTGEPGPSRDAFVEMARSVLGDFELKPVISYAPPSDGDPDPGLVIDDETIVRGLQGRRSFKSAVHKSISDW